MKKTRGNEKLADIITALLLDVDDETIQGIGKECQEMKARGCCFVLVISYYPRGGGDDEIAYFFFKRTITEAEARKFWENKCGNRGTFGFHHLLPIQ